MGRRRGLRERQRAAAPRALAALGVRAVTCASMAPRFRAAALAPLVALACASGPPPAGLRYDFFAEARPADLWYDQVEGWQRRAASEATTISRAARDDVGRGLLRVDMRRFGAQERHALARRINEWSQAAARRHYRLENDTSPADDHWPTFGELLTRNGDDCDGLDLIAYQLMREFGFEHVYRAVIRRELDGSHHMVTLWFEDRGDPWVLDATGAMTIRMRRYSELPDGWTPTQVFSEREHFRARSGQPLASRD
jgi:predicted transglutaminase-like cysteine proteinase